MFLSIEQLWTTENVSKTLDTEGDAPLEVGLAVLRVSVDLLTAF